MTEATKNELPRLTEAMIQAALQAWFAPMQPPEDEDYSRDMRGALTAALAVATPDDPVAWQFEEFHVVKGSVGEWFWFVQHERPADAPSIRNVRPLYAAPPYPFANAQDGMKGGGVSAIAASCEPTEEMVSFARRAAPPELYHMPELDGTSVRIMLRAALRARAEQREAPSAVVGEGESQIGWAYQDSKWDATRWHLCGLNEKPRAHDHREVRAVYLAAAPTSDGR